MSNLLNDLETARIFIKNGQKKTRFDTIYPFTNEDLVHCFENFNFSDKKCLTVLGSSDQALDMYLMGAKEITTFDINPLTYYYFYLKKAAMISDLSKKEYIDFFYPYYGYNSNNSDAFNTNIFSKIATNLSGDSLIFWSRIFDEFFPKQINKNLFSFDTANKAYISDMINYLNGNNYDILKEKIQDFDIKFKNTNITELPEILTENYDFMYFSNIMQYAEQIYSYCIDYQRYDSTYIEAYKKFKELILKLANNLNENGNIMICYFFNTIYLKNISTDEVLEKIFFEQCFKFNRFGDYDTNAVLMYKK